MKISESCGKIMNENLVGKDAETEKTDIGTGMENNVREMLPDEKLSENFWRHELACKCDDPNCHFGWNPGDLDPDLVSLLQKIRDEIGVPLIITSGCRCPYWNNHEGSTNSNSQHVFGKAADIKAEGISAKKLGNIIKYMYKRGKLPELGGIGRSYPTWVHVDTYHKAHGYLRTW